ncbi:hypothetical protein A0H81_00393 [Grifola frondosa]|uniref:Uncharacterized protein n=1 Tax=Grifola frondosa TaxID=5627 RepID=A0A1C7MUG9_GRIFR|nr:hypothetical protein A0H81_00393 [Grifola frondosa]
MSSNEPGEELEECGCSSVLVVDLAIWWSYCFVPHALPISSKFPAIQNVKAIQGSMKRRDVCIHLVPPPTSPPCPVLSFPLVFTEL